MVDYNKLIFLIYTFYVVKKRITFAVRYLCTYSLELTVRVSK